MKLLTINTHSLAEENYLVKRKQFVGHIANLQPDIIAMQEVNQTAAAPSADDYMQVGRVLSGKEEQPVKTDNHAAVVASELRGLLRSYYWTWLPMKLGYGKYDEGMGFFSKKKIAETDVVLLSKDDEYTNWRTRYALGIRLEGSSDWYYSVHFGWWNDKVEPFEGQWERLEKAVAAKREMGKVFLLGDFNSPAEVRLEGYDLIAKSGWHDTYLMAEQKDDGVTVRGVIDGWRDKLSESEMRHGMRIDHIWCSEKIKVKESRCCFNGDKEPVVSDHFGLCIDLED